jgi:hypothetical protein
MLEKPGECGHTILDSGRVTMFRSESVFDRDDHAASPLGILTAEIVVLCGNAEDQSTTVDPEQRRTGSFPIRRGVDPDGNPRGFGNLDITGYLLGETSRQSPKDRKKPGNDDLPREKSRHPPQFGVKGRSVSHADPYPIWTSRASAEMERPWNKKRAPPGEGARVG